MKEPQVLKVRQWRDALDEAVLDPAVNIKIASLGGDSTLMMGVTELKPGAKIKAHVHESDAEVYYILNGEGEMYTGSQNEGEVSWNEPVKVKEGDVFTIDPGMVHQLKNVSSQHSLFLIFCTPMNHLQGNRVVTDDYQGV
jgi:mannose-6-phosphate isomerase-like protein (cupin superfamily)